MNKELFDATYPEEIFQIKPKPIVVINESWERLGNKERDLLTKIIAALKISIDTITVISHPSLQITSFQGKANKLIYFGDLPIGLPPYEVLESGTVSFICSDSLTQLVDNEPARKQLWLGLNSLFALK